MFNVRTIAVSFALALVLSAAVSAAEPNRDPAAVQPGTYTLETTHTRVLFATSHLGFSTWYGDFSGASGSLVLDPANPGAAKLSVAIPVASVSTTNTALDGELKSADWFDAEKFPAITFVSTKVTPTGKTTATVTGDLTFHGVTRPVTLAASFNASGSNPMRKTFTIGFEVKGTLKRSDFGVAKYVPLVGDEVDLIISAPFEKN